MISQNKENQKGVAIMMAVFFVALMSFVLFEISKETLYVSIVSSQDVHELKAYYAAKAGLDVSLLRVKAYQQVRNQMDQLGDAAAGYAQKVDILWQFPFVWPPVLPDEAGMVAQSQLNDALAETFLKKVQYAPMIEDMGAKININNLASPSEALAQATKTQLLEVFRRKINEDEEFSSQYVINEIEEMIDHLTDWMDAGNESLRGGDESSYYSSLGEKNLPPNLFFKTKEEMMLVQGMKEDIYQVLEANVTIMGNPGVNINQAEEEVLLSLDPNMTPEIVKELIKRRQDPEHGPFNESLFKGFVESYLGTYASFNPNKIPIVYSAVANFKIESTGNSGRISKTIEAYVFDQNALLNDTVAQLKEKEEKEQGGAPQSGTGNDPQTPGSNPTTGGAATQKTPRNIPKGPPTVVFMKVY
ncbi:MAG: type II secretion system protein GspK [Bdellovibrionaceae bacterium]|nr:type II secretion system protein GspK [Pseudobdellovibrionaceae bacterium]